MSFNNTDISNGVAISGSENTKIKIYTPGEYDLQFSAQVNRSAGGVTTQASIWLSKNGTNVPYSNTTFEIPGGTSNYTVAAWNWFLNASAGDYYEIRWASSDTNLQLVAVPSPTYGPAVPSVIATVNRVDIAGSNTGSFQGSFSGSFTGSITNAESASYATTASYVTGSIFTNDNPALSASYAQTSSYVLQAISSSYALTSSYSVSSSQAVSASWAPFQVSSSYSVTSSYSNSSTSASYALTASYATTASYVQNAQTASYILQAVSSSYALTASYALNAGGATINTGSLLTTASFNSYTSSNASQFAGTASYALTASYLSGYVSPFPYTGSALITGSLGVTGSVSIKGTEVITIVGATRGTTTTYTKADYATTQDNIDTNMALKRANNGGLYNPYYEATYDTLTQLSPLYTEWNSRFTDAVNYGFSNLVNVKSRTYNTWYNSVAGAAGTYLPIDPDTGEPFELIMHDLINDKYYSFTFTQWTQGPNGGGPGGGGMSYNRELINFTTQQTTYTGNVLDVKGNTLLTGSLNVSQGITGSLLGTSSQAVSSSYTVTASYALNAGAGSGFPYSGSAVITGSLLVSGSGLTVTGSLRVGGSITGLLFGTSSWAQNVQTASFAQSSSNFVITNTLRLDNTLTDYKTATSATSETLNLFQQATGSYTSVFVKYSILNETNARAGEFVTVWNGTTVVNYDNSTTDIGDTAAVTFNSSIVSSQIQINAVVSAGWTVKALATFI